MSVAERLLALEAAVVDLNANMALLSDRLAVLEPAPQGQTAEASVFDLAALLNSRLAGLLRKAGFDSAEAIKAASDEQLLAIVGVDNKALALIRERVQ